MYSEGCGLENLLMAWSHDEYMYQVRVFFFPLQVLVNHGSTLPEETLYAIRFHSFYPNYTYRAYTRFESERDRRLHQAVLDLKYAFPWRSPSFAAAVISTPRRTSSPTFPP